MTRNSLSSWVLAAISTLASAAALTATPLTAPAPFEATFAVTWKGMNAGTSSLALTRTDGGGYRYTSRNLARGIFKVAIPDAVTQTSEFRIDDGRVVPSAYRADDGSSDTKRDITLDFDWNKGRITGTAENEPVDLPIERGTQDPMSIQIAQVVAASQETAPTTIKMVDKTKVKDYEFSREGKARIKTKLGELDTVIYVSRRPGSDRLTRLWMAPSLGYTPVKAERRRGEKLEFAMAIETLVRSGAK